MKNKRKKEHKVRSKGRMGNHRSRVEEIYADYEPLNDEIDQYDIAMSEHSFMEEMDRKARHRRSRSRPKRWYPDWDQDMDDWN